MGSSPRGEGPDWGALKLNLDLPDVASDHSVGEVNLKARLDFFPEWGDGLHLLRGGSAERLIAETAHRDGRDSCSHLCQHSYILTLEASHSTSLSLGFCIC